MSYGTVSTLRKTLKRLTAQDRLWLPTESFTLKSVDISIEYGSSTIDLNQWDDKYSMVVFDKELHKSVTLDFWHDEVVGVFSHFRKQKRTICFWKRPVIKITRTTYKEVLEDDESNDENIQFVWDRIPYYWKR